ncbi:MAG TPA: thiamine phosphate synthase [Dehalococcoidia bacterium]|nr:thiamine phosphate synthase [Dehalococcoidia bacterium]
MVSPEGLPNQSLRIIDANLNRIGESLRLLEDVARLILNDANLSKKLKAIRHNLEDVDFNFKKQLLQARQADSDVGAEIKVDRQLGKRDLPTAVIANSRRIEQSLRVIEELAKTPDIALGSNEFEKARFELYTIEKGLVSRLLRKDKADRIKGLYVIVDTDSLKGRNHLDIAKKILEGGTKIVQLRDKTTHKKDLLSIAVELNRLCREYNALFIVNDYIDIAIASDADGVHIGQDDIPLPIARRLMPMDKIIGYSVYTPEEAVNAQQDGADYIATSAIYPTCSKADVKVIGLEGLQRIKDKSIVPLVGLGGITYDNISEVISYGADSVAVISAILGARSPDEATRQLIKKMGLTNE